MVSEVVILHEDQSVFFLYFFIFFYIFYYFVVPSIVYEISQKLKIIYTKEKTAEEIRKK